MNEPDLSPEAPLAALVRDKIVCGKGLETLVREARKRRYRKRDNDYDTEKDLEAETAALGALCKRDPASSEADCVECEDDAGEGAAGVGAGEGEREV